MVDLEVPPISGNLHIMIFLVHPCAKRHPWSHGENSRSGPDAQNFAMPQTAGWADARWQSCQFLLCVARISAWFQRFNMFPAIPKGCKSRNRKGI